MRTKLIACAILLSLSAEAAAQINELKFIAPPEARVKALLAEFAAGDPMRDLAKQEYDAAHGDYQERHIGFLMPDARPNEVNAARRMAYYALAVAQRRMLQAELDLAHKAADREKFLSLHVKRIKSVEEYWEKYLLTDGRPVMPIGGINRVRFDRIRAEIWLEQFKKTGKLPSDAPALLP